MNRTNDILRLTIAELASRKRFITATYAVAACILVLRTVAATIWPAYPDDPGGLAVYVESSLWVLIVAGLLVTHALFRGISRQGRDRMLALLPVAVKTVGISRLLAVLFIHAIPLVVWPAGFWILKINGSDYNGDIALSTYPVRVYHATIWTLFSMLGVSAVVCLLVALAHTWRKPLWGNVVYWIGALFLIEFFVYPAGSSPEIFVPGISVFTTFPGVLYYGAMAAVLAGFYLRVCLRQHPLER